ncbi:hypothetical protein SAMD00019534_018460, partial [Acytostelium subglobosum LB1]|uniref:hypothetical protein n=1 Tax=Acytostelium subglobosum LB1 TaxID=1410327 RepID=UPI0006449DA5
LKNYYNYNSNNKLFFSTMSTMSSGNKADRLVWVDLEMTGLDIANDCIMEMACIVTDEHLNIIEKGPDLVVHLSDDTLNKMNDWCTKHHGESGLTEKCRQSKLSIKDVEKQMVDFIAKHVEKGKCPLAGNTVHEDKKFLLKEMPAFVNMLHYRIVDVSTVKELTRRWYPDIFAKAPPKRYLHRSLADIEDSIEELQYYRATVFK